MAELGSLGEGNVGIFREEVSKKYDTNDLKKSFKELLSHRYTEADMALENVSFGVNFGNVSSSGDLNAMGDFSCDLLFGNNNKSLPTTILELKDWGCLPLTEIQMASTAILKAGLDQISWEPLYGILEDLALTGTVSQNKVHTCAIDIITRLLGSDMVPQVLMQYHTDPSASEVIMIESLILCYIKDLIQKRRDESEKTSDRRTTSSSTILSESKNSRKKPSDIREKKTCLPSYQKTTESFKRKQRSKRVINADLRVPMKRSVNKYTNRDENNKVLNLKKSQTKSKTFSSNSRNSLIENIIIDSIRSNANIISGNNLINRPKYSENLDKGDNPDRIIWTEMRGCADEDRKEEHLFDSKTKSYEPADQDLYTSDHCRARKRKKSARDWDEIEMETAVDTYYAERDLSGKNKPNAYSTAECANKGKYASMSCLELTMVGNNKFEKQSSNNETNTNVTNIFSIRTETPYEVSKPFSERNYSCTSFNSSNSSSNTLVEAANEMEHSAPEKDNCKDVIQEEITRDDSKEFDNSEAQTKSKDKVTQPPVKKEDSNRAHQSETKGISKIENIQQSSHFFKPIMKDTSSSSTGTSDTSNKSIHDKEITCVPQYPSLLQSVMTNRNLLTTNKNGDHVIALRISEELMEVLKEKFIMTNHYSNVSVKYPNSIEPSPENVNLQIEQMRTYNGKILMRLNFISTLTVMALFSSVLTASAFYFSSDPYVKATTLDVIRDYAYWIFSGWCR